MANGSIVPGVGKAFRISRSTDQLSISILPTLSLPVPCPFPSLPLRSLPLHSRDRRRRHFHRNAYGIPFGGRGAHTIGTLGARGRRRAAAPRTARDRPRGTRRRGARGRSGSAATACRPPRARARCRSRHGDELAVRARREDRRLVAELARSAPVRPDVWRAIIERSTLPSGLPRVCTFTPLGAPPPRL